MSPFTLWVPTLHTEGLQQSEVSSVQPASLRLRWVYVSAISVCFWTPRLSLGHPMTSFINSVSFDERVITGREHER